MVNNDDVDQRLFRPVYPAISRNVAHSVVSLGRNTRNAGAHGSVFASNNCSGDARASTVGVVSRTFFSDCFRNVQRLTLCQHASNACRTCRTQSMS